MAIRGQKNLNQSINQSKQKQNAELSRIAKTDNSLDGFKGRTDRRIWELKEITKIEEQ